MSVQQERLDIEEKYSSLQEEVAGKTKKLKKVWTMYMQAKSEVSRYLFVKLFTDIILQSLAVVTDVILSHIFFSTVEAQCIKLGALVGY